MSQRATPYVMGHHDDGERRRLSLTGVDSQSAVGTAPEARSGADSPFFEWVAESLRSILARAEALGLVRSGEIAIDSLADRLREEAIARRSCVIGPAMVGGFARKR